MSRPRILITSGPTREYLDPVRYLSNGSSGQMGSALADAAIKNGFNVTIVSGPVSINYPDGASVIPVVSTQEMFDAVLQTWPDCVGLIAAAAPSDFRPATYSESKIKKSVDSKQLSIELIENPDILAEVGRQKTSDQWTIGFALETDNAIANATEKLKRKNCDFIVLNDPSAIDSKHSNVSIINSYGEVIENVTGSKRIVAQAILALNSITPN